MRREQAIELLRRHRPEIAARGVRALYLFGSTRRDQAGPTSDVDLFIDYEEGFSLLDLVAVKEEIDQILGAPAELTTRGDLHPLLRDDILREPLRVFCRPRRSSPAFATCRRRSSSSSGRRPARRPTVLCRTGC